MFCSIIRQNITANFFENSRSLHYVQYAMLKVNGINFAALTSPKRLVAWNAMTSIIHNTEIIKLRTNHVRMCEPKYMDHR